MTQFNIHPTKLANLLFNAVALSEGPATAPGFGHILISVTGSELAVYGQGRHTAGVGRVDLGKDVGEASVCITRDQADSLQSVIRGLSKAKDAVVIVDIHEDGTPIELEGEDGVPFYDLVNLTASFGTEALCALPDSDPDATGTTFWDHIDALVNEDHAPAYGPIALGVRTISVLTKLKPPVDKVDIRSTSMGQVVAVKHGDYTLLMGTTGREDAAGLWPTSGDGPGESPTP